MAVWDLVLGRGNCNSTDKLAKRLIRFAKKEHTSLRALSPNQMEALDTLNTRRRFTEVFRRQTAAAAATVTVVTSGSEEDLKTSVPLGTHEVEVEVEERDEGDFCESFLYGCRRDAAILSSSGSRTEVRKVP
ncbi:expressed unknown protein [Seminavis robusta]|uniref:Uncharacterized protein n=1 Tax=Seminavis robusta TaxID=568900 RepID=A0A9N8H4Y2_9STRA|nr:expressed unknown protein [Seminavis robusta]|eukprot:Sro127_g060800.1 n/a (132) ;mRNA; r:34981-35376